MKYCLYAVFSHVTPSAATFWRDGLERIGIRSGLFLPDFYTVLHTVCERWQKRVASAFFQSSCGNKHLYMLKLGLKVLNTLYLYSFIWFILEFGCILQYN